MTIVWVLPSTGLLLVADRVNLAGLMVYVVVDGLVAWIGAAHRTLIEQSERQRVELAAREQEAEAANQAKDEFMAVLGHEPRTPLTTIVAGVRVLHHIGSPEARAASIRDAIERQADQLTRLVDDLLDVKRIITGPAVLERPPCDLGEAVTGFTATWNGSGRFKDHTLLVDAETVWVNGDTARLQQIVDNLMSNAVKYTPAAGSISVSVNARHAPENPGRSSVLRLGPRPRPPLTLPGRSRRGGGRRRPSRRRSRGRGRCPGRRPPPRTSRRGR